MRIVSTVEQRKKTDNQPHIVFGVIFARVGDLVRDRDITALDRIEKLRKKRKTPLAERGENENGIHSTTDDGDNVGRGL